MTTNSYKAQDLIYGTDGFGAINFKMFPGSGRDATAEMISSEIAASVAKLLNNELEEITDF